MLNLKRSAVLLLCLLAALSSTACRIPPTLLEEQPTPFPAASALPSAPLPNETGGAEPTPEASAPQDSRTVSATLYYITDEGYLLPVAERIPSVDGIARACLMRLVDSPENAAALKKQGLIAPIPAGTELSLSIAGGEAVVDLRGMSALPDAARERALYACVVNTLLGFPTVERVSLLIDGSPNETPNGSTPPSGAGRIALNAENGSVAARGSAKPLTLYVPTESAAHYIPVTRYVEGSDGLSAAVGALVAGTELPGLRSCFPRNTLLLGATIENGILTVNLSKDFEHVAEQSGLYSLAMHAVLLTAMRYGSVDEVQFAVNGMPYEP